jgi:alpha-galactosidase
VNRWLRSCSIAIAVAATVTVSLAATGSVAHAAEPPVSQRPVMGYNTWYEFGAGITEAKVLAQAQAMESAGLAAAGYNVITLDDGWQGTTAAARAAGAGLTWNAASFPHGIPWLAGQLKSMGLRLGIYTAIGKNTCTSYGALAGSYGNYSRDAALFASWGVSFVKVDSCNGMPAGTTSAQLVADFQQFGQYIEADGMYYSEEAPVLLPIGSAQYLNAVAGSAKVANMWRVAPDESWANSAQTTIIGHLNIDLPLARYASPGHWNDLDMLVPGEVDSHPFNWSVTQEESQLAVWAMEASPLILSTNVTDLTPAELAPLVNPAMIAIDQSGTQASHLGLSGSIRYAYKGADHGMAVMLANTSSVTKGIALPFSAVGLSSANAVIRNVFAGSTVTNKIRDTLAPGQAALFVLNPA